MQDAINVGASLDGTRDGSETSDVHLQAEWNIESMFITMIHYDSESLRFDISSY